MTRPVFRQICLHNTRAYTVKSLSCLTGRSSSVNFEKTPAISQPMELSIKKNIGCATIFANIVKTIGRSRCQLDFESCQSMQCSGGRDDVTCRNERIVKDALLSILKNPTRKLSLALLSLSAIAVFVCDRWKR